MMRNHQHILSIRKRCAKAKEELSVNLHTRLKWVMYIQVMTMMMIKLNPFLFTLTETTLDYY